MHIPESSYGLLDPSLARKRMLESFRTRHDGSQLSRGSLNPRMKTTVSDAQQTLSKSGGAWERLFPNYGPRRRQLFETMGMWEAIDQSDRAKGALETNCQDYARLAYEQHVSSGSASPIALAQALEALATLCEEQRPCDPKQALGRQASRREKAQRMVGLASEASLFAALCQLPEEIWNSLLISIETNRSNTQDSALSQLSHLDLLTWLKQLSTTLFKQGSKANLQTALSAIIITAPEPLRHALPELSQLDISTTEIAILVIGALVALYIYTLGPRHACIRVFHKKSCLVDATRNEVKGTFSDGSTVKRKDPVKLCGPATPVYRMLTCSSLRSAQYEPAEVVRDTFVNQLIAGGVIALIIYLVISLTK